MIDLSSARSFLFVPADRPERFEKAHAAGADAVVVDLEDAVAPAQKTTARQGLMARLDPSRPIVVRVNAAGTEWHDEDLALVGQAGISAIMLPKAERAKEIARVRGPVIPLVETALGMAAVGELAGAPRVVRLAFGTIDFMVDLGIPQDGPALDVFRAQMVLASRLAGIAPPIDGVTPAFQDPGPVEADTRRALLFGFGARLLIHPRQVEPVHRTMRPAEEEVAWSREVLELVASASEGALNLRGTMIDRPVIEKARRILARA